MDERRPIWNKAGRRDRGEGGSQARSEYKVRMLSKWLVPDRKERRNTAHDSESGTREKR